MTIEGWLLHLNLTLIIEFIYKSAIPLWLEQEISQFISYNNFQ